MKIFFAILTIAFLAPVSMAIGDITCWFWIGQQCSSLVWDPNRTLIAFISFGLAIPCSAVWISI